MSLEDFRECERIQLEVWGALGEASEVLSVTAKYGGAVIGAFASGKLAGFIYAFSARRRGQWIHWSHQMAVRPSHRDRGLGFRMKMVHRRMALAAGIRSICWTFDPLESRNATINIARLGGRAEEYVVNCYGNFASRIERGLPTDRFVVNWRIGSAEVARRLTRSGEHRLRPHTPVVNEVRAGRNGFIVNRRIHLGLGARRLLVEIPANTDEMRAKAIVLARRWRKESRRIFRHYFSRGYQAVEFLPPSRDTGGRCFYVLQRNAVRPPDARETAVRTS